MADDPLRSRLTPDGQGRFILDLDLTGPEVPDAPPPSQELLDAIVERADPARSMIRLVAQRR
jgi:hypothetical protein